MLLRFASLALFVTLTQFVFAQKPDAAANTNLPNSHPVYRQLRTINIGSESAAVNNLVLKRDAGKFTFKSGTFYFLVPVEGKVTGAVFIGEGSFTLEPPNESERRSLRLLTKEPQMAEQFEEAVFRFTDGTYEELKKAAPVSTTGVRNGTGPLEDSQHALRKKLRYNLAARILQDVLSGEPGGLFFAFIKGKRYNGKMLFAIDPNGLSSMGLQPEEVALMTYDENKYGIWGAFHSESERAAGMARSAENSALVQIENQELDISIEKSARMDGTATTTVVAEKNGARVLPFELFGTLRVTAVSDSAGQPLAFIQEDKDDDPDYNVILPKTLKAGEQFVIRTKYAGKDAITNEGGGNYYLVARHNWYPSTHLGDYAHYKMTLRIPKGLRMVASGTPVRDATEGNQNISEWKTDVPQAVAGFNFGKFKREQASLGKEGYLVESYANEVEPDIIRGFKQSAVIDDLAEGPGGSRVSGMDTLGSMSTVGLAKKALAEAQVG